MTDSKLPLGAALRLLVAALLTLTALGHAARAQQVASKNRVKTADTARAVRQYTIEQFMDTTRVGGSSFSSDEKEILFHSNKTGIFNVYTAPVAGGAAKQLTNSTKESTYSVSYLPSGSRFIYTYDRGGNENSHLYVRELDGSERDLTPGEKTKANFLGWAFDRKSFLYSTNERDARFFDVYEMVVSDFKPRLVYKDETGLDFGDVSNDKRYVAFQKNGATTNDSDVYVYDTTTKELKNITAHAGDVANAPANFDPQSKSLYFLTDSGAEFRYAARYDLASGKTSVVEKAPWDVMYTYLSRGGKYRVTAVNQDARTVIRVDDAKTGKPVQLPKLPNA